MYGQFQNQNFQAQGFNQNQFSQDQSNGGNYVTPTEMRMYSQTGLHPSQQFGLGMQNVGMGQQSFAQGGQPGLVFNSNRQQGNGQTYITPTEQRMYQSAGIPGQMSTGFTQGYNQGFGQMNQSFAQNYPQSSGQFNQAGLVFNSNRQQGNGETYVVPTEQQMYQNAGIQNFNRFNQGWPQGISQYGNPGWSQGVGQYGGQGWSQNLGQLSNQGFGSANYGTGSGQTYVTPTEQRMYQTSGQSFPQQIGYGQGMNQFR